MATLAECSSWDCAGRLHHVTLWCLLPVAVTSVLCWTFCPNIVMIKLTLKNCWGARSRTQGATQPPPRQTPRSIMETTVMLPWAESGVWIHTQCFYTATFWDHYRTGLLFRCEFYGLLCSNLSIGGSISSGGLCSHPVKTRDCMTASQKWSQLAAVKVMKPTSSMLVDGKLQSPYHTDVCSNTHFLLLCCFKKWAEM